MGSRYLSRSASGYHLSLCCTFISLLLCAGNSCTELLSKHWRCWESIIVTLGNARQRLSDGIGGELAAKKLLPEQAGESQDRERADLVLNLIGNQLKELVPDVQVSFLYRAFVPGFHLLTINVHEEKMVACGNICLKFIPSLTIQFYQVRIHFWICQTWIWGSQVHQCMK